MSFIQVPSVGGIVHYIMDEGNHKGEHRPAIITHVWSNTCVQLTVFTDWSNDINGSCGILWRTSVLQNEGDVNPKSLGSWHWPEFVPPKTLV